MGRRFSTLTFSLCASMTVHALLLCLMAWWYMKHPPSISLAMMSAPKELAPIIIRTPPPPPPPPPPKAAPQDFSQATKMPLRDDSGETNGKGTANRSTPGERPMEARQGLEQANLSRSNKPDENDSKLDEASAAGQAAAPAVGKAPTPAQAEFGVGQPAIAAPSTGGKQPSGAAVEIKGHSSPSSDTDSFAMVAQSNNVRFHDGKMEARQGRKVKTTRPNYGLAAMTDAQSMPDVTVVLGVTVDAAGNVSDVTILHSSGSENIDLPTKAAVYNWWFEPKKDKDGRGLPDLWVVRID
jgi:protein TonB